MKKLKLIIFMCLLIIPLNVYAKDYGITNYYISVKVNENNIYDVTENYNVTFFETSSFKKEIKLRPKVYLSNGKFISYITEINDLYTSNTMDINKTSKYYELQFESNKESTSDSYNIKYQLNMGSDLDHDFDIVYIDLVDKNYEYILGNISFSIELPAEIKEADITFLKDGKICQDSSLTYNISNGNNIQGIVPISIISGSDYSIQIKLPDKTFSNIKMTSGGTNFLLLIIPVITLALGIILLKKYKNKPTKVCSDPLKISNEYDSAEIAYLYNGKIHAKDIITILINLANEGYISIENNENKFKINKIKDYDKDNAIQKIMLDGLFQNKKSVDIKDIEGIFYPYYVDACRTLQNRKNYSKLFYSLVDKFKLMLVIAMFIGFTTLQIQPLYNLLDSYVFATILSVLFGIIMVYTYKQKSNNLKYVFLVITFSINIVSIILLINYRLDLLIYIVSVIILHVGLYIENLIPIRTDFGQQKLYDVNQFKIKLASMNDEFFEEQIKEDNDYFYKMLPYVMIFDMTSWWFTKFFKKVNKKPNWYNSSETYSQDKFQEFIQNMTEQLLLSIQITKIHEDELLQQSPNKKL